MEKYIAFLLVAVGVLVVIASYAAQSSVLATNVCEKPNPNTKECYDPDNAKVACSVLQYQECKEHVLTAYFVYDILQFPKGAVESDVGLTRTELSNCWRWHGCKWDGDQTSGSCKPAGNWSSWTQKFKTVENTDECCPDE